jgi:drug/metabolite transporter (DMT)-like permease
MALATVVGLDVALVLSWSAGFVGIRFTIDYAPIFLILLWRSLVSGLVLLPFALWMGPRMRGKDVLHQMAFGAVAMSGYLAGYSLAIAQGAPTGIVALITDMLPLAVALLSWPVLGQALTGRQWVGTGVGVAGVLIASGWSTQPTQSPGWVYILPVLGTTLLALATLLQKRSASSAMPVYQSLCLQCLSASVIFAGFAWNEGSVLPVMNQAFAGGIAWLVCIATFGAWGLYYIALRKSTPARVTAVLYVSPPVTMIWAWVMFNEPLSWAMAMGLVVSLIGILIVA